MLFNDRSLVMLPNSLFVVFVALAGPELAGQRQPIDFGLAPEPGVLDQGSDELAPSEDADLKGFDSSDGDDLVQRDNPHHPAPSSNPCKKKENEPKGCPGDK
ncbi:hypothetical protein [Nannocystis punicea]|uniref:Uncharacterized protein n=1 Tax=Nannocystis punicea TaxID=2995304 RepID=A0ABY7H376_9BACT|nr:hypothetical protein [Nannocystis poenicansa]WAS93733.1 hypothetical protein O0S08_46970 [Nannocystis poenicansa]